MKRTIPLFTFAVAALLIAGRAYALDAYVSTAGSNDNDGGDWDHALLSISDAYARVAAAGGGTVHVAGGIYRSTQGHFTAYTTSDGSNAPFTPANDVTLAGSTDPANPTIITGDRTLNNTWEDGSPQWSDGALQLPPEDACLRPRTVGAVDTHFLVATAAATNCVFRDLTIHGFTTTGIDLEGAENVRILNCRFIGIGDTSAHPSGSCIILRHAAGVVSNCLFVGYNGGAKVLSANATPFQILDSHFRSGYNKGAYNGYNGNSCPGISVQDAAELTLSGCTFGHLMAGAQNFCFSGTAPWATFTNCVVSHCIVETGSANMANICSSSTSLSLVGCNLSDNAISTTSGGSGGYYGTAACLRLSSGDLILRDCTFTGNTLEQPSGNTTQGALASVAVFTNFRHFQVVNCAFVSNAVNVAAEGAFPCTFGGWRWQESTFANCVFRDNDCLSGGVRLPEFRNLYFGHANNSPTFVNTVVWHAADDYVPFDCTAGTSTGSVGIASCIVKGFHPPAASGKGFQYGLLDADPRFAPRDAAEGFLSTPKLCSGSPALARHGAVKVCQATDGNRYFLDTNKSPNEWRKLGVVNAGSLSIEDGAAIGLFAASPSIPDIFGNPRATRSPIGPYALCPSPATVVEVR